jgi:hypothetical protein
LFALRFPAQADLLTKTVSPRFLGFPVTYVSLQGFHTDPRKRVTNSSLLSLVWEGLQFARVNEGVSPMTVEQIREFEEMQEEVYGEQEPPVSDFADVQFDEDLAQRYESRIRYLLAQAA